MPALSDPINQQLVVERLDDITDDDQGWYLVGKQADGLYRIAVFTAADCIDNHVHQTAAWMREAMLTFPRDGLLLPGMTDCAKWTVMSAPQFDCKAHDTFKWDVIKERLDAEEIQEDEQDDEQGIKQLYLGSILYIVPSGQVRAPWSSAKACQLCGGEGTYTNALHDPSQYRVFESARSLLTKRNADKGLCFADWPEHDQLEAKRLDMHLMWCRDQLQCPFCRGDGSRVRVEDGDFMEYLEEKAGEFDAFITGSDGDGCDVLIAKTCPLPKKEDDDAGEEEAEG